MPFFHVATQGMRGVMTTGGAFLCGSLIESAISPRRPYVLSRSPSVRSCNIFRKLLFSSARDRRSLESAKDRRDVASTLQALQPSRIALNQRRKRLRADCVRQKLAPRRRDPGQRCPAFRLVWRISRDTGLTRAPALKITMCVTRR